MAKKDPRIDAYIAKSAEFAKPILKHLRNVVHTGCPNVEETMKWQFPHFDHKGMMCGMAAFKQHCAFGFWKAELVFGRDNVAAREAMGHFGRITKVSDLPDEKTLIGYVRKAAELNEAGVKSPARSKPKRKPQPPKIPDYFSASLAKNASARKVFENFSPSNQREYVEWVAGAKRDETREQRLKTSIEWVQRERSETGSICRGRARFSRHPNSNLLYS
jgi:uncharacterized protein YdeI (YjbR/CyaY-like superfamily)